MSQETTTTIADAKSDFEPKKVEMTLEDFMQAEHLVQTGVSDTLPDGRTVKEAQKANADLQAKQEQELKDRGKARREKRAEKNQTPVPSLKETVEVTVHETGVTSVGPVSTESETQATANSNGDGEPANDLPADFPGRKALLAAGVVQLEKVASFNRETLLGIEGIGAGTTDKILAYGKPQ